MLLSDILILAPHLQYPPVNGADILIAKRIEGLNATFKKITVISMSWIEEYTDGHLSSKVQIANKPRSKLQAAVFSLFTKRSYLYEKFLTGSYKRNVKKHLRKSNYSIVFYSFLHTAFAFKKGLDTNSKAIHIIETHNDDVEWFSNIKNNSGNFISRVIAQISISFTKSFLFEYGDKYQLIVLTKSDADSYGKYLSEEKIWTIPPGCKLADFDEKQPQGDESIKLLFIGSLGIKSNQDALINFRDNFLPILRHNFGNRLKLVIAGNNPDQNIKNICSENDWELKANLSDRELTEQYTDADFCILPFAYSTGFKLKLLESFAHGVPVLATNILKDQIDLSQYNDYGIFSDDAGDWCNYIEHFFRGNNRNEFEDGTRKIAAEYSWIKSHKTLFRALSKILENNN